ncbi:phosphoenolpyruvate--protein phosphotransferase [Canibacter oris]|uniref:Phosphoenolpyruvate-protein phosphotransferase n=1 Tax=Canibacter oris TaxID=1365628 RepID=A0A840DD24_9MICO|nr:phosphoenolpyruvate--protein phosphotransferase [Canibacter oris]MBB4071361.1 phosphotransferase system enzyme I (PtsI) [Canibacter oris]
MTVGIVAVSHSLPLAEAALQLALEMIPGEKPPVALAAGTPDGGFGTDAVAVSEAIATVDQGDGVVVLVDLGSAVLSAEMALEFLPDPEVQVQIVPAPFVEGLLAATVRAATGGDFAAVAAAARTALEPKLDQLGAADPAAEPAAVPQHNATAESGAEAAVTPAATPEPSATAEVRLVNPLGLHARPAGKIAALAGGFNAQVQIINQRGKVAAALSPLAVAGLATKGAETVTITASGADAAQAVKEVAALIAEGFDEADPALLAAASTSAATTAEVMPGEPAGAPAATQPKRRRPLGVSAGRVYGPVLRMGEPLREPAATTIADTAAREAAAQKLGAAFTEVQTQLTAQAAAASGHTAEILQATAMFAADPALRAASEEMVLGDGLNAAAAVWRVASEIATDYEKSGGALAERASDVRSVRDRVVAGLTGQPLPVVPQSPQPFILVARDLAPADTAQLDPQTCLGMILGEGGPTSHTAILARSYGIAAVVDPQAYAQLQDGDQVLLDGSSAEVVLRPDAAAQRTARTEPQLLTELQPLQDPGALASGERVLLLANVGGANDVPLAVERGAEGVGLFRTEFCFLGRTTAPTFAEQKTAYGEVFAGFDGAKVVVRTLDAGSDKPLPFVTNTAEENPALGVRGWRIYAEYPEILEQQLAAIAAAAAEHQAEPWVMAPMISTPAEAAEFVAAATASGLPAAGAKLGVMVETPAAALSAAEIFEIVDFVSIGTNDLAQYTLAADRMLTELAHLNSAWQPAVLRAIAAVGEAAAGRPVGVCGEAAADPLLAAVFVGLGVNSLSMTATALPIVGGALAQLDLATCQRAAAAAIAANDAGAAREAAAAVLQGAQA